MLKKMLPVLCLPLMFFAGCASSFTNLTPQSRDDLLQGKVRIPQAGKRWRAGFQPEIVFQQHEEGRKQHREWLEVVRDGKSVLPPSPAPALPPLPAGPPSVFAPPLPRVPPLLVAIDWSAALSEAGGASAIT